MIRKLIRALKLLLFVLSFVSPLAYAAKPAILLEIKGAIGPATQDYIERGLEYASKKNAALVILQLNTPGGLDTSMRGINQAILASSIPVVTFVAPSGARAASAGTFILYASHVAAMAPGTNVGAASPVQIGGTSFSDPENKKSPEAKSTEEKKAVQDFAAYIRSLAVLHDRNIEWAEKAVKEASSLSAEEALKLKVIDMIADNVPMLLKNLNGRSVKVQGGTQTLQTSDVVVETLEPDWRFQFLSVITDPTIAYILLLMGIYGLFFEFSNPGFILPGVAGAIALLLALYAFQLLPINYAGFGLLLLGIGFMIIELYVSSFGILGIGGAIAFIVGSILLIDTHAPGYGVAWQAILLMSLFTAGFFLVVLNLMIGSLRKGVVTGREALINCEGEVLECNEDHTLVRVLGEIWKADSKKQLQVGQKIRVTQVSGLLLTIEPLNENIVERHPKGK